MPLFGKKRVQTCPICQAELDGKAGAMDLTSHWQEHVEVIPPGQGDASGQFTWKCTCGPAGMKWENDFAAAAGLCMHMTERHGFRMS